MAETNHIKEHIERCIELYASPIDTDFNEQTTRQGFEQMRADLMLAVGMLMAIGLKPNSLADLLERHAQEGR